MSGHNSDLDGGPGGDKMGDVIHQSNSNGSQIANLSISSRGREGEESGERLATEEELATKAAAECLLGFANVILTTATTSSDNDNDKGAKRKREETSTTSAEDIKPPPTKRPTKKNYCKYEGCTSQAHKGGVCIKHGAQVKRKLCSHPECPNQAQRGGICIKHGAKVKLCKFEGCTSQAKKGGVCMRHGAKRKLCNKERLL